MYKRLKKKSLMNSTHFLKPMPYFATKYHTSSGHVQVILAFLTKTEWQMPFGVELGMLGQ
jgi:hypothetical protein